VIDRPKGNVLTAEVIAALRGSLADLPHAGVRLVTLEGAGDHFSFGASVEEHLPEAIGRVLPELHALIRDLLAVPAPTGAIVRGRCLGGGFELALACDFLFAADNAWLGVPEITLGVFPPAAAALLPLKVGAARAAEAVVTGQVRQAADWLDAGLVTVNQRFALFYPEKRPFFLEGIELFGTPQTLVYTRRIVDPKAGAKLTGKFGQLGVAHLTAVDETGGGDAWFNITRLRRDFGRNSIAGVTFTNRDQGEAHNRVLAGDFRYVWGLYYTQFQYGASWSADSGPTRRKCCSRSMRRACCSRPRAASTNGR